VFKNALSDGSQNSWAKKTDFCSPSSCECEEFRNFKFFVRDSFLERNKQSNKNLHFSDCDVPAFLIFQLQVEKAAAAFRL